MREYVGCPPSAFEVGFVPGDPPRPVAVADRAAYLWPPDQPDPVVLPWDGNAWNRPILEVSQDGKWLVAGPRDQPGCWNLKRLRPGLPYELRLPGMTEARFTGEPGRLAFAYVNESQGRYDLRLAEVSVNRRRIGRSVPIDLNSEWFEQEEGITSISDRRYHALSAAGRCFALATSKRVLVWTSIQSEPTGTVRIPRSKYGLSFSPDGTFLAVNAGTGLYVYSVATLELICQWTVKYSEFPRLAWSPDGRFLARTDETTTVRVYTAADGREVMAVGHKRGRLESVAFSPDGLTLATGTHLGPVRVWDVE